MPAYTIFLFVFTLFSLKPALAANENPLLLIVAYDGMRYDYINSHKTPFLWELTKTGVFAPRGIQNTMWTMTMSSFFSISTGLYQEHHGIMGNHFYDPVFEQLYDYFNFSKLPNVSNVSLEGKWYTGEPIWQTNEKHDSTRLSGAMRWPTCDARINNKTMKICVPPMSGATGFEEWKDEIDTIIGWFTDKSYPINFGLYYNPQPDMVQHGGDIYRHEVKHAIRKLDDLTKYLYKRLEETGLLERMNIIFTSDHGFVNIYNEHNIIDIDEFVSPDKYIVSERSIFPRTDKGVTTKELYQKLKAASERSSKFDVYLKEDFPDEFHYKNNRRVGPIILLEKPGYWLVQASTQNWATVLTQGRTKVKVMGMHGYSNQYQEMIPFFIAHGPLFKEKYKMMKIGNSIDLYELMCHILQVTPSPNDGKLERISEILRNPPHSGTFKVCASLFLVYIFSLVYIL